MKEKKFEKRCPGPVDCFGDREVLFRKVLIPMAMGDDTKYPPKNGAYRNSLVVYEANGAIYIYSSDGLYTKLSVPSGVNSVNGMSGDVTIDIPSKISQLQNDLGYITKDVDNLTNYTKTSGFNNVAFSGSYLDLSNKPAINNGQLTINRNGSTVGSFKANQFQDTTVNIRVPVYTNELINNSQFVVDGNYVHTDNNFNDSWKNKLAHLADIQTIGSNLTLTNGRLDATGGGGVTPADVSSAIAAHNSSATAHADIRNDITAIDELIPNQATTTNQLADKAFVNSSVQTATANFRGNWTDWVNVPTVATDYPVDYAGNKTPTVNDYLVVQDASDYTLETLEGTWRFKYTGTWDVDGKAGWHPEYQVNETPLTAAQLAALNSGITAGLVAKIPTVANVIITLGVDMGTGTMIWSGADSVADVRSAYENGATITILAPLLTDEVYKVTETWWGDQGNTKLWLQSIDNDLALLQVGISDDNSVDYTTVGIQGALTAGSNITISGNTISASSGTVDEHISDTSTNALANKAVYYAAIGGKLNVIIPNYSWNTGTGMSPYTHYFDLSYNNIPGIYVNNDSIIELINDNPVDFTKYGWAIYSVDTSTKKIRIVSIGKPTGSTTLNMFIRGDYS